MMASAKAKLVLQPLFLKDADELSEWALPLKLDGTKKRARGIFTENG